MDGTIIKTKDAGQSAREQRRLAALARYEILDTEPEPQFDEVVKLAADICDAPIAVMNLIADGRQFFKAEIGVGVRETPLDTSFCTHALLEEEYLEVPDATKDARFTGNPLVTGAPHIRFYAGALLRTRDGDAIGTLCVADTRPRRLTELQQRTLKVLAHQLIYKLDLRLTRRQRNFTEARYKTLFDSIDEGFCIIEFVDGPHGPNSDYVHIEANAAYEKNTGIPNVVGQYLRQMVPDEADKWVARFRAVLETGEPLRFEQKLEATGRYLSLSSFRIEPKELRQVAVLFQDITARKKAELELVKINTALRARADAILAERRVLADVMDGTPAIIQVKDMEGRWIAINQAGIREFEQTFGRRPQLGQSVFDLLADHPDYLDRVRRLWGRALAGEEFVEVVEHGTSDDDKRYYEVRFNALRDEEGKQIGACQFVYDVTERLQEQARLALAEDALRQSQKMEAVGQLTGGLAHDFNNLLAGISGALEMIGVRLSQGRSSDVEKYLSAAQGAARRAGALTHRLLAFSRQQTLSPKPIIVNRLLADLSELVRRTVGPSYDVEVVAAGGLWPTLVDENQLENAILNLCINARDAMKDGGKITIETANKWLDNRAARERDLPPGQYVSISVTDTGTGIEKHVLERVFDPFFTTKPIGQGTGLGLSMVYGFVRQSNGQVRIYTEVGKGTTVSIYLPKYAGTEAAEETHHSGPAAQEAEPGETVLVVDDEAIVRMLIVDGLAERGYACREARDGPEALKYLEKNDKIDLLITDVGLPGGMNGRQVAEAARKLRPGLKILFVTGYAENAALNHGHIEPGMEVLTKPFVVQDLSEAVGRLLHSDGST